MIHLLHFRNLPIYEQLKIEEALLRADDRSYCILNEGSSRAIVLGISSKLQKLVDVPLVKQRDIPMIQRFSGGGTVYVDEGTVFATFILNHKDLDIRPFPEPILKWAESFYQKAFDIPKFHLNENDFVIDNHKIGGNAQYIQRKRWLLHTSFLWNFKPDHMKCLLQPDKEPKYRKGRFHKDFLTRFKDHISAKQLIFSAIKRELKKHFTVKKISLDDASGVRFLPHRKSTTFIEVQPVCTQTGS